MRLASSWMVITSGMITSRMTLSRGCTTPAWRSFSRSRRRRSEASERSRCASSKALLMVSLMRSRRSSPVLTGLLGGLAPFFLARDSSSASASTSRARGTALGDLPWRGASPPLAFSAGRALASGGLDRHRIRLDLSSRGSAVGGTGGSIFSGSARARARAAGDAAPRGARARPPPPRRAPLAASSARRRASSSSVERPPGRCITSASRRSASSTSAVSASAPPGAGDRALLLLLDDHRLRSAVAEALLDVAGIDRPLQAQRLARRRAAQCLLGGFLRFSHARPVLVHVAGNRQPSGAEPSRYRPRRRASSISRRLAPPSAAAACTTFGRPMAKLNSAPVSSRTMVAVGALAGHLRP